MSKLPAVQTKQVQKILIKDGWKKADQTGTHEQYKHPFKSGRVTVPVHGKSVPLQKRVLKNIFEQAQLGNFFTMLQQGVGVKGLLKHLTHP